MRNKDEGITLVSLIITIIVLIILAGIGLNSGIKTIKKAKLEEIKTNMLLIEAKAREYMEDVNHRMGIGSQEEKVARREEARNEIYVNSEKLSKTENEILTKMGVTEDENSAFYSLSSETKQKWGLDKLENESDYIIKFDEINLLVEIYNSEGIDERYSLTDIEQIEE